MPTALAAVAGVVVAVLAFGSLALVGTSPGWLLGKFGHEFTPNPLTETRRRRWALWVVASICYFVAFGLAWQVNPVFWLGVLGAAAIAQYAAYAISAAPANAHRARQAGQQPFLRPTPGAVETTSSVNAYNARDLQEARDEGYDEGVAAW